MTEDLKRAWEWLFGEEIKPPISGTSSELEAWRKAHQGALPEPEEVLRVILETSQNAEGWSQAAKDDFDCHIAAILEILLQSGPPPPESEWEKWRSGRMRLMFFYAFALGRSWTAAEAEFGVNGARIEREKRSERGRKEGGERTSTKTAQRRKQLTSFIEERLCDGDLYKNAVSDAVRHFDMPAGTIRRLCPKKNFSSHS